MTVDGKTLLITGGTGSLGKVLVRRVLSGVFGTPRKVIVFSRDEAKQHEMRVAYLHRHTATDEIIYENFRQFLEFRIGDVRDYGDVCRAVKDADIVINAAALKQVPTCEYFPDQALLTNCMGAMNLVQAIRDHDFPVEAVVGVSTDKACKPVNVMGMTKALQERIIVASNVLQAPTRFIAVRYGNVLASRGSVIPLFLDQIRRGGPVTITAPEMTRFLISLDQAVDMIFAAVREAKRGETFVPICPSTTVANLAAALIGDAQIPIHVTGPRPGEKLHEILISEEEVRHVRRCGDYFSIVSMLPELAEQEVLPSGVLAKEYSSANSVASVEDTAALLRKHGLMPDQQAGGEELELLR